ncbi:protein adenylyltransferase SelO [Vibrio mimicus]|uniref:protein adenylyltransferase SelO n=1 Tax=Vibrio mimicus TaxID=674 RepID=UPI0011D7399F|nr:YdiU family protein [Vibrio mimicus]TXY08512.1 YdiU family protein [Vibrio mimicus]
MSVWNFVRLSQRFAALPKAFYTSIRPQPLENVRWGMWNAPLAQEFGLPEVPNSELLAALSGQQLPADFAPLAMKYAGHQFGVYNPDLGDGRGLLLAEMASKTGDVYDIHLKGAGLTPYSRMGDGRAVLRSSIREYLCSEAMAGLGIATTRALALMNSDTPVYREREERGALLVRVAQSHIRFGHFEHFYYTEQHTELKLLADKVIEWHFPTCAQSTKPYADWFHQVVERTALMIAQWQVYGFNHGVMNTDNMSILGQTFDYGPFAFLDDYDPNFICNHSDYQGRYAFDQQPRIGLWNLSALAHALSPLIEKADLEAALESYSEHLNRYFSQLMRAKLGLATQQEGDGELFADFFALLANNHTDYTRFLRELSCLDRQSTEAVIDLVVDRQAAKAWLTRYLERAARELGQDGQSISQVERCQAMRQVNPKYILRNYLAQQAIELAERGDFQEMQRLAQVLATPYDEHPEFEHYAKLPPEWGKKLEISCSS